MSVKELSGACRSSGGHNSFAEKRGKAIFQLRLGETEQLGLLSEGQSVLRCDANGPAGPIAKRSMPYNLSIPGQVSEFQLKAIEAAAGLVPKNGKVVEVGSLFGSSSWAWAKSVDPSVTVYCIDPWAKNEGVRLMEARYGITYGLEQFKKYTADCPNIAPRQGYSPRDFLDWVDPIDLYYEDAVHAGPILAQNLSFWSGKLKPSGIICGDDYRPRFPDVCRGAQELAGRLARDLIQVDFFWCLLPDDNVLPGSSAVATRLRELGRDSDAYRRSRGPVVSAAPRQPIGAVNAGENSVIACRIENNGIDPWPTQGRAPLDVGVRVVAEGQPDRVAAEHRMPLQRSQLDPDMPVDVEVVLPTGTLPPGSYRAIFDVLGGDIAGAAQPAMNYKKGSSFAILA